MTIEYEAIEFETAHEAIQWTNASGRGVVARIGGKYLVIDKADGHRLAAAGVEFAYLFDHEMPDGGHRIMTIPIN